MGDTEIAGTESQWPSPPKTQLKLTPGAQARAFYKIVKLCNQYNHNVIVMTSQSSVFPFRWEMPWHMCSQVMLTFLHISQLTPMHPHKACYIEFCSPIPMAVTFSLQVFQCALILEPVIY